MNLFIDNSILSQSGEELYFLCKKKPCIYAGCGVLQTPKYLNSKRGAALPTVLMVMVVAMILIVALLNVALAETNFAARQERRTQAHYLGRSGVNVGLEMLENKVPYDNDITDLVNELNTWANSVSPASIGTNETFDLSYELIGPREIKIISEGNVSGGQNVQDTVTLRVRMLTSLLTGGKAEEWYSGNSATLTHSVNPYGGGHTYLGQGIYLEGKNNTATLFPSNSGGESIFQASVMQFLKNSNNVSLSYSGQTQPTRFDSEILIFDGRIIMNDTIDVRLLISDVVAKNKINNSPTSVLYVTDSDVRSEITNNGNPDGVGFENEDYYNYFTETSFSDYNLYPFQTAPYKRYGIVYFGEKVVRANNENQSATATNRLPYYDPNIYAEGYFFYPDNLNINASTADLQSKLIPIRKTNYKKSSIKLKKGSNYF